MITARASLLFLVTGQQVLLYTVLLVVGVIQAAVQLALILGPRRAERVNQAVLDGRGC